MKITMAVAALLAASGCGSSNGGEAAAPVTETVTVTAEPNVEGGDAPLPEDSEQQSETGPGTFETITNTGGFISAEVPVDAGDPRLAEIEKLRESEGLDPLNYVLVRIDNEAGSTEAVTEYIAVIGEGGESVEVPYITAGDGVLEDALSGPVIDYYNTQINDERVRQGAITEDLIYATYEDLPSAARVFAPPEELSGEVELMRIPG